MYGHLGRAVRCRNSDEARMEFRGAANLFRALIKTAENLVEHRYGGVQEIIVVEFVPRVGMANKIQQLKLPKPGSPEALLVEHLQHIESLLEDTVSQFGERVRSALDQISDYQNMAKPSRWFRDAECFEDIRGEALKLMGALSAQVNTLERGHRQVVVKKRKSLNSDGESVRDRDFQFDTECDSEDAKPRTRQPIAN